MTWTPTTLTILDGAGTSRTIVAYTDGTNFSFPHSLLDNTGAIIAPATSVNQATMITALGLLSTSALQTAGNASLATIATNSANILPKGQATSANSAPVVIASDQTLPLPTGAATSANQATGNTSLATIAANSNPVPGVISMTVGTPATAGRSFAVICSAAGNVNVTFSDTSTGTYPVLVGLNVFPFAVTQVNSSGTTATATYQNWK
jgi:hypothetical protein